MKFKEYLFSGDIILAIQKSYIECWASDGGTGPGYGDSLSSLSVDLRMVINNSNSSDQTQIPILKKKFIHFNAGPVGAQPPDMETGASD